MDVDAATISIARLSGKDIDLKTAAHGILIAVACNTISKAVLAGWIGGGRVGIFVGASSAIACHVMNFAYHYGANAKWDPKRNRFASGGNSKWLTRDKYRDKWVV